MYIYIYIYIYIYRKSAAIPSGSQRRSLRIVHMRLPLTSNLLISAPAPSSCMCARTQEDRVSKRLFVKTSVYQSDAREHKKIQRFMDSTAAELTPRHMWIVKDSCILAHTNIVFAYSAFSVAKRVLSCLSKACKNSKQYQRRK